MRHLASFIITTFLFVVLTPAWAQESNDVELNIEPQPLSSSLREVADSFDLTIAFYSESTDGIEAPALDGDYTSEAALNTLLADTNLEYTFINDYSVAVRPVATDERGASDSKNSSPAPILMAQNTAIQTQTAVSTRSEVDAEAQGQELVVPLEEIVVVGTNIRGIENPTVPVLTFNRQDIDLSGAATVEEFLRTIPQNFNSINAVSESGVNDFGGEDTNTNGSGINLRGLGAGTTLTLLNGRRMSATGSDSVVDVSVLPLGAIERVEVLTDGASAVYGSDAVAGVVNFITRKDYEGFEVRARYGRVADGSKEDSALSAAGGFNWGTGGVLFGAEYAEAEPMLLRELSNIDTSYPAVTDSSATIGAAEERFSATVSLNQDLTDRFTLSVDGLFTDREASRVFNPNLGSEEREQRSSTKSYNVNTRLEYDVTDSITAALFYDYSLQDAERADENQAFDTVTQENLLQVIEGNLSGTLFALPSGDQLSFAVGWVYREESYKDEGITAALNLESVERDVSAVYAELLFPLVGQNNRLPFVSAFDLSVAGRYEDYSDFGSTFNPKVGLNWEVNDNLRFMGSYSRAFHAPDLTDINARQSLFEFSLPNFLFTAFPEIVSDPSGRTVALQFIQNRTLTEETADVWSLGTVYAPRFLRGIELSATYFLYDYQDRVEGISGSDVLSDPAFNQFAIVNPTTEQAAAIYAEVEASDGLIFDFVPDTGPEGVEFISLLGLRNVSERKVEGLDINIGYEKDAKIGLFSASLNAAYLFTYKTQVTDTSPVIDQLNVLYRPTDLNIRGTFSWTNDGITVFAAVNHTNSYQDNRIDELANDIDAFTTVDLALTLDASERLNTQLADGLSLSFNLRNVFDEDPPFVMTTDGLNFDTTNADPFGRQISVALTKAF